MHLIIIFLIQYMFSMKKISIYLRKNTNNSSHDYTLLHIVTFFAGQQPFRAQKDLDLRPKPSSLCVRAQIRPFPRPKGLSSCDSLVNNVGGGSGGCRPVR